MNKTHLRMQLAALKMFLREMEGKLTEDEVNAILDRIKILLQLLEEE